MSEITYLPISETATWITPILSYLELGTLPDDPKEAKKNQERSRQVHLDLGGEDGDGYFWNRGGDGGEMRRSVDGESATESFLKWNDAAAMVLLPR
ncbi:hypothetical protein PIB30_005824 [Stylosanthes scabra]|uniref:Uncharacterized protein n=1 Tax=Stylosanthes scabra TaxID=79078 RepID=A0ABU6Y5V2_9FABA|nr:hypothetical protein [Stylosanthes scabra]